MRCTTCLLALSILLTVGHPSADGTPEIVVQMGHGDVIRALDGSSPDGDLVASGSMDGTVKVWRLESGRLLRTLPGHTGGARAVSFGPGDNQITSGGADGVVRVWDLDTGAETRRLTGPSETVTSVLLAPRGQVMAGSEDGKLWVWEVDAPEARSIDAHPNGVTALLRASETRIVSSGNDGAIRVWDLRDLASPLRTIETGRDPVNALALSRDGKRVASAGDDGVIRLWSLETGRLAWEAEGHAAPIHALTFDGGRLVSAGWGAAVQAWMAQTGVLLGEWKPDDVVGALARAPGGGLLIADGRALLHAAPDGDTRLEGPASWAYDAAASADGAYMASGHADGGVRYWDIRNGRMLRTLYPEDSPPRMGPASAVDLSADGAQAAAGGGDGIVRVWEAASGELLHAFDEHEAWIYSVDLSPTQPLLATGSADQSIGIWDLRTGELLHLLEGHRGEVTTVAFSTDGARLLSASGDGTLGIWDVATGEMRKTLSGHDGWVAAASWSGSRIVSGGEDGTVRIWNASTGEVGASVDLGEAVFSVLGSPDGKQAWAGTLSGRLVQIDVAAGRILADTRGHTARVSSVASIPGGKTILTASWDGTVKLRDPDGRERVAVVGMLDGDWLATTPDGTFAGSIDGGRYVAWRIGRELYPFERYEDVFRKPDILRDRITGKAPESQAPPAPEAAGTPPSVTILLPDAASSSAEAEAEVTIRVADDRGLSHVDVRLDGRPVQTFRSEDGENEGGVAAEVSLTVPLNYGDNTITVIAVDTDSLTSDPASVTVTFDDPGPEAKGGDLWVVVVGVSEHSNPRYSLTYPAIDASAMAEMLEAKATGVYDSVHVHVLNNQESTTPNILRTLNDIAGRIRKQDVMMMFIAGHGVSLKTGEYFFITHDGNPMKLKETAFSWREFEDLLRTMPARSVLLFADTCHSGNIVKPDSRFVSTEEMADGLVKESGVIVFVSSQGCEVSLESTAWGHGAFTYALLEALGGKANYQPDGVITMAELQLYVPTRVRRITKNKQHPRIPRLDNFNPEMPVVGVESSEP